MLHLIFQSPVDASILERMSVDDVAVFLESGVFAVIQASTTAVLIKTMLNSNRFYVLLEDMQVRGILATEIVPEIGIIDYSGLVKLTVDNQRIASWC